MNSNYVESIYKVVNYIQKNADKVITVQELADIAGFSQFHFHRIFTAYMGESLSSFVKRIRLEKSAHFLAYSNVNITEIALSCGYETPSAYTKAFKQLFNVNPSRYKQEKNYLFKIKNKENYHKELRNIIMNTFKEIKEIDETNIISVRKVGDYKTSVCAAWSEICSFAYKNGLINPNTKMIGMGYDNPNITAEENLRYDACITIDKEIQTEGNIVKSKIQAGRYAVFLHKGPYEKLSETYMAIFAEWLPGSHEKLRGIPSFEIYLNKDPHHTKPENLKTEIYIPIE